MLNKLADIYFKLAKIKSKTFNLNEAKSIRDYRWLKEYCDETLQKIHEGSSRASYILTGRFVFKVAKNQAGLAQNLTESQIGTDENYADIIARVHDFDPKGFWVISDLVRPLILSSLTPSGSDIDYKNVEKAEEEFQSGTETTLSEISGNDEDSEWGPSEFKKKIDDFANEYDLVISDMKDPSQWGKRSDGKIVLLDYGLDSSTQHQFYGANRNRWKW